MPSFELGMSAGMQSLLSWPPRGRRQNSLSMARAAVMNLCIPRTDFRRLNAQINRKPFPLPKISDNLRKLSGFKYATAIDLSMGYYHIPLDLEAQKLCTNILPWGKYQYKRLPMGVKTSPDIFQRIMYELLGYIPNIQVYIDDKLITSN
jgi:hypothetical protein